MPDIRALEESGWDTDEESGPKEQKLESDNEEVIPEPETFVPTLNVKVQCECENCQHWVRSADWSRCPKDQQQSKTTSHEKPNLPPLLVNETWPRQTRPILRNTSRKLSRTDKFSSFDVLVHSESVIEPVELCTDTAFDLETQKDLQRLNYTYSRSIQAIVWPAIFSNHNVFAIGNAKGGKTMAYLPPVCSLWSHPRNQELRKYRGPLTIIVCATSQKCEQIYELARTVCNNMGRSSKIGIITYPIANRPNLDILVTLPESLLDCLHSNMFTLKRLCHLVFEDTDILLKDNKATLYKILEISDGVLKHRRSSTSIQLIFTSEKWTRSMRALLDVIYSTPVLCFGSYLEAAFYSGIDFQFKFAPENQKIRYLIGVLSQEYRANKTIVFAKHEEITNVSKELTRHDIETLALSDHSTVEQINEAEYFWNSAVSGDYKVLLCTEDVFDKSLAVTEGAWLVHYSFPATWTRFTYRFKALASNYKCPLEPRDDLIEPKTFLIVDEHCDQKMPRIMNLMQRFTIDLPPKYQKYSNDLSSDLENEKLSKRVPLCNTLKLFGECTGAFCQSRHILHNILDESETVPRRGKLKFNIIYMRDVNVYNVMVRQHIDGNGICKDFKTFDVTKPIPDLVVPSTQQMSDIEVAKLYIYSEYPGEAKWFLCSVTRKTGTAVEIRLLSGQIIETNVANLYNVPTELRVLEIHIADLIPPQSDKCFSGRAHWVTKNALEALHYKEIIFTADILLELAGNLWLDNIIESATIDKVDVVKFDLKKHLLQLKVAQDEWEPMARLRKQCETADIDFPIYQKPAVKLVKSGDEAKPDFAFLQDGVNEVILSSAINPEEIFIRLLKFQPILEELESEMTQAVRVGVLDKPVAVKIGGYYLAPSPNNHIFARVQILNVDNERALCFYVDYGDEGVFNLTEFKLLPSKFLKKLPFQAIQCRLHGVIPPQTGWQDHATDILYSYVLEPDSDIFRCLYVKPLSGEECSVRTPYKYSILMKDCWEGKSTLVNQILIDCGFACTIFERVEDFDIEPTEDSELDPDNFDLEIFNTEEFLSSLGVHYEHKPPTPSPTKPQVVEPVSESTTCPSPVTPRDIYLTPELYWTQDEASIKIRIQLIGVVDYDVSVMKKRYFRFRATVDGKRYEVKWTSFKAAELQRHEAYGQEVRVQLGKVDKVEWPHLTATNKRQRNIHYDVPQVPEAAPKPILTLDMSEEESGPEDASHCFDISDGDSELDGDFAESSSED